MTIINILGDGTVYPPLRQHDLVIRLLQGQISLGRYDRLLFTSANENYLHEPTNVTDRKAVVIPFFNEEIPVYFEKKKAVHIICPQNISAKADWNFTPQLNSFSFSQSQM